jgi:hypothetical protein
MALINRNSLIYKHFGKRIQIAFDRMVYLGSR